jgi:guanine deaminase
MNRNCPEYLRNDEANFDRDCEQLAHDFGRRFVATDRFAVSVDSALRRRVVNIANRFDLRTQTHLNEQLSEKRFVEETLYPGIRYTEVYRRDGLLDHAAILGHCIHMTDPEMDVLARTRSMVAHCPVSNTLLGSGIMPLDAMIERGIEYAICTDVGASPTTSLLNEMAQFLKVHAGRSRRATPSEALQRATRAAARIMGRGDEFGALEVGRPMSVVEIDPGGVDLTRLSADDVIARALLGFAPRELDGYKSGDAAQALDVLASGQIDTGAELDWLVADVEQAVARVDKKVHRVIVRGGVVWERNG